LYLLMVTQIAAPGLEHFSQQLIYQLKLRSRVHYISCLNQRLILGH
jgi:hypothetical protein